MSLLSQLSCSPLKPNEPAANDGEVAALHPFVPVWQIVVEKGVRKLQQAFVFDDEKDAEKFVARLEKLAEMENHHPVIEWKGRAVKVAWWTHVLGDIHPNDFIMASKTEGAYTSTLVGAHTATLDDVELPRLHEVSRFADAVGWRQELVEA